MINQANRKCILLVALTCLVLSGCSLDHLWERKHVVTRIPVGADRAIVISTDDAWEISQGIYYEVTVGEKTVVPLSFICHGDADSLTFKSIVVKNGDLVGVYEETRPERLLLLHDFVTGITWPGQNPGYTMWDSDTKGRELVQEIEKTHPGRDFTLESGAACGARR